MKSYFKTIIEEMTNPRNSSNVNFEGTSKKPQVDTSSLFSSNPHFAVLTSDECQFEACSKP